MKTNEISTQNALKTRVVYWIVFTATLLGMIMPAIALLLTLRSMDGLQHELSSRISETSATAIVELIETVPRVYGDGVSKSGIPYFAVYVVYNFLCIVFLLLFSKRAKVCIDSILNFYKDNNLVCFVVFFLIVSFQSKMFFGFWFSGIAGWDFSKITTVVLPVESEIDDKLVLGQQLLKGVNSDNLITYFEDGCINGQVVLGFTDNEVVAINHGIAGVVFPEPFLEFDDSALWLEMTNHGVQNHAMGSKLLDVLRYPNHSTYLPLDIEGITGFKKIEVWDVVVCHEDAYCYIAQAELVRSYAHN